MPLSKHDPAINVRSGVVAICDTGLFCMRVELLGTLVMVELLLFVVYVPMAELLTGVLFLCHFVLVFFSPFSIAITSLGEERANLSAFRTFVRFVLV